MVFSGFFVRSASGPRVAVLSEDDHDLLPLPVFGANPGANVRAVASSVPVALALVCSGGGVSFRGSEGKASRAPWTSSNRGSV